MIQAVIFDSDGMLTHGSRFSDTYSQEHGIDVELMAPFFKGPFNDCLIGKADLKEELEKGWLEKWGWKDTSEALLTYWFGTGNNLDSRVYETISQVAEKGPICVLATNQEKYRTEYLNKEFDYDTVFDKIFSSAHVGAKKPHAEFFENVYQYFKTKNPAIEKSDVLFWDDDEENIAGAKAYGFATEQYTDFDSYVSRMKELSLL